MGSIDSSEKTLMLEKIESRRRRGQQRMGCELPGKTYDLGNAGNLISGSSSFSKSNLDIWNFLVHIMQKTSMQYFKHYLTSMGDEYNCPMVRIFFYLFISIGR